MKAGETKKAVSIPIINDPSGQDRNFVVQITEVEGRDQLGDDLQTKVNISNEMSKLQGVYIDQY